MSADDGGVAAAGIDPERATEVTLTYRSLRLAIVLAVVIRVLARGRSPTVRPPHRRAIVRPRTTPRGSMRPRVRRLGVQVGVGTRNDGGDDTGREETGVSRKHPKFGTREWEDAVYRHVTTHGQTEGEILEEYERLAHDETMSPAFRYLAQMILTDEVRHHRVFDDLAATLAMLRDHSEEELPIPSLAGFHADRIHIQRITDQLLRVEREDLRELKEFSKELKELRKINLWCFLIELMIDDTKQHIKILEYIRDRAEDQPD